MYYIIYIYLPNTQCRRKQSSLADFAIVAKDGLFLFSIATLPQLICDVTQTWRTDIVTSYSSICGIDFSGPGINGLACVIFGAILSNLLNR